MRRRLRQAEQERLFDVVRDLKADRFLAKPGAANAVKLSGNFLIVAAMEAMAEALAMLEKSNIDRVAAIEMLSSTLFACPVYQGYGKAIAEMRHSPAGFRLPLGLKDVELVLKTSGEVRAPMPVAGILRDRFLASIARGHDDGSDPGCRLVAGKEPKTACHCDLDHSAHPAKRPECDLDHIRCPANRPTLFP